MLEYYIQLTELVKYKLSVLKEHQPILKEKISLTTHIIGYNIHSYEYIGFSRVPPAKVKTEVQMRIRRFPVLALLVCITILPVFAGGQAEKGGAAKPAKQTVTMIALDVVNFRGALEGFIAEFNKDNPDVEVVATFSPQLTQTVLTELQSGNEHDVMMVTSNNMLPFVRQEKLAAVPADFEKKMRSELFAYSYVPLTYNGKIYGVPYNFYPTSGRIMYNPELWAKEGLDPKSAKTWDELMTLAQKLTKRDASGKMTQAGYSAERNRYTYFMAWILQFGGKPFNDNGSAAFDSEFGRQALSKYAEIYQKWMVDDPEFGLTTDQFKKGVVATTVGLPWFASILAKDTPNIKWAFLPMPQFNNSLPYWSHHQVWAHYISKKAAAKEGVWRFMNFLLTPDVSARWSGFSGELSPVKKTMEDKRVTESPFLGSFVPLMEYGKAEGISDWLSSDVMKVINTMLESVARKQATVDEAIKKAAAEVTRLNARMSR
jgi:ABC-type glycerol-3-phosphate transport system substrate-binding protein